MFTTTSSSSPHITKSTTELMLTDHEQPTNLTYPDRTQLANNDSTEIDCNIRLVLAATDDSDKESNGPDIQRFHPTYA